MLWPSATALHPFSLVFPNELGTQRQAVPGPQGRLLKMISNFIPEAESGLAQIIGMQAVMRIFSCRGQQEVRLILSLKFDYNLELKNFNTLDIYLDFIFASEPQNSNSDTGILYNSDNISKKS